MVTRSPFCLMNAGTRVGTSPTALCGGINSAYARGTHPALANIAAPARCRMSGAADCIQLMGGTTRRLIPRPQDRGVVGGDIPDATIIAVLVASENFSRSEGSSGIGFVVEVD